MTVAAAKFFGGSTEQSVSGTIDIDPNQYRLWVLTPTGAGKSARLPDATRHQVGGPVAVVVNAGAVPMDLTADDSVEVVRTLAAKEIAEICLMDNSTANGSWGVRAGTYSAVPSVGLTARVYAVGGVNSQGGGAISSTNFERNPRENSWRTRAPLGFSFPSCSAVGIGSVVYAYGRAYRTASSAAEIHAWDFQADAWTAKTGPGDRLDRHSSTAVSGKAYKLGGDVPTSDCREYDPSGDAWTARATAPSAFVLHSAAEVSSVAYTIGRESNAVDTRVAYSYTPGTNAWATKATPTSLAREGHVVMAISSNVYVMTGRRHTTGAVLDENHEYSVSGDSWASKRDHPLGVRSYGGGEGTSGVGAFLGGATSGTSAGSVHWVTEYTAATDAWAAQVPMPQAKSRLTNAVAAISP